MSPRIETPSSEALQEIVQKIATGQISQDEGRRILRDLWEEGNREPLLRMIVKQLFPSLRS